MTEGWRGGTEPNGTFLLPVREKVRSISLRPCIYGVSNAGNRDVTQTGASH